MIPQILMNSLITGSIYACIAFGFSLVYGTMGFFNMGYGAYVLIGAYLFYTLYRLLHVPLILAGLLAGAVSMALWLAVDRLCYYRFRQKRVPSWTSVVISMAIATFCTAVITILFSSGKKVVYPGIPISISLGSVRFTSIQLISVVVTLALMLGMNVFLKKTELGKRIRAISNDKTMAQVVGIDLEATYRWVIGIGAALSAVAGVLMSLDSDLRPTVASRSLLYAILVSIVGGSGNITGAWIAGILIGFTENVTVMFIGSGWREAISLALIIIFMLVKPSAFGGNED